MTTMARDFIERPHAVEHDRSVRRQFAKGAKPRNLLGWFMTEWAREVPTAMHGIGTFVGQPDRESSSRSASLWAKESQPADLVGGSHLGSPSIIDAWRRYIENADNELDSDGYYVRPIHAALRRVNGKPGSTGKFPFMAKYLLNIALASGDWLAVSRKWAMLDEIAEVYTQASLDHLWNRYSEQADRRAA